MEGVPGPPVSPVRQVLVVQQRQERPASVLPAVLHLREVAAFWSPRT